MKFSMASGGPALPEVTAAIEAEANRLLRLSGTEPMVRLYVKATSPERLDALEAAARTLLESR